jgi:starch synthase (maltosyl-transferring)
VPDKTRREPPTRIQIQHPAPAVDGGRYAAKRCLGDTVTVSADIFRDGHDKLRAVVRFRAPGARNWHESEMLPIDAHVDGVRWEGEFVVDERGRWEYTIQAWTDVFGTWRDELQRKVNAGQTDLAGEMSEGLLLLRDAASRAKKKSDAALIEQAAAAIEADTTNYGAALGDGLHEAVERCAERHGASQVGPLPVEVDRIRARFGAWYELFPRSSTTNSPCQRTPSTWASIGSISASCQVREPGPRNLTTARSLSCPSRKMSAETVTESPMQRLAA